MFILITIVIQHIYECYARLKCEILNTYTEISIKE